MPPLNLADRGLILVEGADVDGFFQRILTANLAQLQPNTLMPAALLSPQGKILTEFLIGSRDGVFYMDMPIVCQDDALKRLKMLKLRADVSFVVSALAVVLSDDGGWVDSRHTDAPKRQYVPAEGLADFAPNGDWHDARIALGLPELGLDYDTNAVFPTDVNLDLMGGLDFGKGCFVGQEVVSRMKRRGTIRRRTLIVSGDGITPGAALFLGGTPVGEVTSGNTAKTQGLAKLRIDRVGEADTLTLEAGQAVAVQWPKYDPDTKV